MLGYINIAFENGPGGHVLEYTGGPIVMDNSISQDKDLQAKVDAWREPFAEFSKEVVGWTNGDLDETRCQFDECASCRGLVPEEVLTCSPWVLNA